MRTRPETTGGMETQWETIRWQCTLRDLSQNTLRIVLCINAKTDPLSKSLKDAV